MEMLQKFIKRVARATESEKTIWKGIVLMAIAAVVFVVFVSWYQFLWATDETVLVPPSKTLRTGMTIQDIEQIEKEHARRSEEYENIIKGSGERKTQNTQKDAKK
jgi:capsular polysaccharide biosynthesis protein